MDYRRAGSSIFDRQAIYIEKFLYQTKNGHSLKIAGLEDSSNPAIFHYGIIGFGVEK